MRTVRGLMVGVLIAGGLVVMAPGAVASTPAVSKTCQSLNSLNQKLQKALTGTRAGKVDVGAVSDVASSFRKAAKTAPGSVKSSMNTIAGVAGDVAHSSSTAEAAAVLKSAGAKIGAALLTWGNYVSKKCSG